MKRFYILYLLLLMCSVQVFADSPKLVKFSTLKEDGKYNEGGKIDTSAEFDDSLKPVRFDPEDEKTKEHGEITDQPTNKNWSGHIPEDKISQEELPKLKPTDKNKEFGGWSTSKGPFNKSATDEELKKAVKNGEKLYPVWRDNGRYTGIGEIRKFFTPDNDGINDVFSIEGLPEKYPNFEMKVYNRNGLEIYAYKHNGNPNTKPTWWDGTYKGSPQYAGIYLYIIKLSNSDGKITGAFYLLR